MECFFFTGRVIQLKWSWVEMKTIIILGMFSPYFYYLS